MTTTDSDPLRSAAEAAWAWVLAQVQWADGPWIPTSGTTSAVAGAPVEPPPDRDGLHSGVGGLAHALAEIRLARAWTDQEAALARAVADRLAAAISGEADVTYFDGLTSTIGALTALGRPGGDPGLDRTVDQGVAHAVERLIQLATDDGWPQVAVGAPRYVERARVNDLTLGTAGVLAGALWADRHGVRRGRELADLAASILLAEGVPTSTGTNWPFVPARFLARADGGDAVEAVDMPNLSHGLAGIAAVLAVAGAELDRPELVTAAASGAEHLVSLADTDEEGFVLARTIPHTRPDLDEVTYTWCHGPTGTSLLFAALEQAGVNDIAGRTPREWHRRCRHSVLASGLPERTYPGFWDNDGRCCGTAGVGDVFLDSWHRYGQGEDLTFALQLADTLVERAIADGPYVYWRFLEHRDPEPLLPPGVGWMQGAAGIAAYLFRAGRVLDDPSAPPVPRMDTWWACAPASPDG